VTSVRTSEGFVRSWNPGRGTARAILGYLMVVFVDAWIASDGAPLSAGLAPLTLIAIGLVPAVALTIELIHRFEATSIVGRSAVGAASWVAWGVFVSITLAVASHLVLVPESVVRALSLLAVSGAAWAVIAADDNVRRPGRALTLSALAVTALVVLVSLGMAGHWGGPA
jgi:hypothetical protein